MIKLNQEYFNSPYYFYLKDKGSKINVYYSVSETIVESRKNDDVVVIDKKDFENLVKCRFQKWGESVILCSVGSRKRRRNMLFVLVGRFGLRYERVFVRYHLFEEL